jgi:hypothetical protein
LIGIAMIFSAVFLLLPLINVFAQAFAKGWRFYLESLQHPDTLAAVRLTLTVAAISVPLNLTFGLAAAWAIAKFEFRGKAFLITIIDLPFAVSPVISGLVSLFYLVSRVISENGWMRTTSKLSSLCRHCSRHGVRYLSVCRAGVDSGHASDWIGTGTGGFNTRCQRLADLLACHLAVGQMGFALRRNSLQCPGDGRIWRRLGGFRPHYGSEQHHAVTCRETLQRIQ